MYHTCVYKCIAAARVTSLEKDEQRRIACTDVAFVFIVDAGAFCLFYANYPLSCFS